jgi:hypothetical protein
MTNIIVHLIRGSRAGLITHKDQPPHVIPLPEEITDARLDYIKRFITAAFERDDFPKPANGGVLKFEDHPQGTSMNSLTPS